MNDLVFKGQNDQVVTTSLKVAEVFKKEHRHVLDAIRKLMTAENSAVLQMFREDTYLNDQNKPQPMFIMNRDGFTLLVMGFNGKKALDFKLAYINAFNTMEAEIKAQAQSVPNLTSAEALLHSVQLIVAHERQLNALQQQVADIAEDLQLTSDESWSNFNRIQAIEDKLSNNIDAYTVVGYCTIHGIKLTRQQASTVGGRASRLCKKRDIPVSTIADPRFGKVNVYPSEILHEVLAEPQQPRK